MTAPRALAGLFRRSVRSAVFAVILAGLMAGIGCFRHKPPPRPKPDFHVVLLMDSKTPTEMQAAFKKGLHGIEADLFATADIRLVAPGQPLIQALRRTGREAPDIVFCHVPGEEYVVVEEAAAYQDTQFVAIPGRAVGSNVSGVVFRVDGAAYVAGATLSAAAGERPVLLVRPNAGNGFHGLKAGFEAGVASARGKTLQAVDIPDALSEIGSGRPGAVFFAGFAVPASLRKACVAAGVPLVAVSLGNPGSADPGYFGVVIVRVGEAVRRLVRERWAGTLEGRIYSFSLGSGVVDFKIQSATPVSEAVQRAMDSSRADVLAGIAEIEDLRM